MGSPAATRWQPNERLRAQRLRRAWSLADVVRELCALADRLGERPLGVNVTMVYNWETGRHRPRRPTHGCCACCMTAPRRNWGYGNRPDPVSCGPLVASLFPRRALPVAGPNAHYG